MHAESSGFILNKSGGLGRPLRCLAVALLLFAQLSFANHFHEAGDLNSHDCTLCSQLHTVKSSTTQSPFTVAPAVGRAVSSQLATPRDGTGAVVTPPCRAPPFSP